MRTVSPVVALAVLGLLLVGGMLTGPAAAEEHVEAELLEHVNPRRLALDPGEEAVYDLVFEGGPFTGGWLFLFNAKDVQGAVDVTFSYLEEDGSEREIHTWRYADNEYRLESTQMPWDGFYRLRVENLGDDEARVVFFYDQACNCAAKPIPVELPQGMVVFNVDVQKGSTWRATVEEPPAHQLRMLLAFRLDDRSIFPEDFGQVAESINASVVDGKRVHVIEWEARETGRYYLFADPLRTDPDEIDTSDPPGSIVRSVMIVPRFERIAAPEEAPGPGVATVAGLAVLLALVVRRRL